MVEEYDMRSDELVGETRCFMIHEATGSVYSQ